MKNLIVLVILIGALGATSATAEGNYTQKVEFLLGATVKDALWAKIPPGYNLEGEPVVAIYGDRGVEKSVISVRCDYINGWDITETANLDPDGKAWFSSLAVPEGEMISFSISIAVGGKPGRVGIKILGSSIKLVDAKTGIPVEFTKDIYSETVDMVTATGG